MELTERWQTLQLTLDIYRDALQGIVIASLSVVHAFNDGFANFLEE